MASSLIFTPSGIPLVRSVARILLSFSKVSPSWIVGTSAQPAGAVPATPAMTSVMGPTLQLASLAKASCSTVLCAPVSIKKRAFFPFSKPGTMIELCANSNLKDS